MPPHQCSFFSSGCGERSATAHSRGLTTPEIYRRTAQRCLTLADWAADETIRKAYRDLSSYWQNIADREERNEVRVQVGRIPDPPNRCFWWSITVPECFHSTPFSWQSERYPSCQVPHRPP